MYHMEELFRFAVDYNCVVNPAEILIYQIVSTIVSSFVAFFLELWKSNSYLVFLNVTYN